MTTHDMQPEMADQTVRGDRRAETQNVERPRESADTTGDFANPMEPRQAPAETYEAPAENYEPPLETDQAPDDSYQPPVETGQAPVQSHAAPGESQSAPVDTAESSDAMLFADSELTDMRSRWVEVQSAFVDDPRDCVQKADGLVADVVDKLTRSFAGARAHLEEQWSRGEEVSTEDLRIALKRYREFFERLLAV
jgi:hypothetical protein